MTLADALALALARHPDTDTDDIAACAALRLALTALADDADTIDAIETACAELAQEQDANLVAVVDLLLEVRVELHAGASWLPTPKGEA